MIRVSRLTARPLTARKLIAYKLGQQPVTGFDPIRLFSSAEEGTFLDFTSPQVYADTAGTDPAEVGEGIAFIDDKSPNDTDATQATSTARPIFARVPVGGRRNLLERTEEFNNAVWTPARLTVSANAAVDPNGTTTADLLTETAVTGAKYHRTEKATVGVAYGLSVYAKSAGRSVGLGFAGSVHAAFNLSNGTVISGTGATIESVGDGWYRCFIPSTADFTAFSINIIQHDGNSTYTGDGTSGIYVWGAQLELGTALTPYQKVVTANDITEAGVSSIAYANYDGVDDILPITLPAITGGTVALVGLNGIWIEDNWDYAGGTLSIGPTTIAGLPAGILNVVGDLCAVIINDRAWTAAERAGVVAWGKSRGAPGVFGLGPNLVTNGTLDADTDWTKSGTWAIGSGVASCTGTGNNISPSEQIIQAGKTYILALDVIAGNVSGFYTGVSPAATTTYWGSSYSASSAGSYVFYYTATTSGYLTIRGIDATIDNVSLLELELLP